MTKYLKYAIIFSQVKLTFTVIPVEIGKLYAPNMDSDFHRNDNYWTLTTFKRKGKAMARGKGRGGQNPPKMRTDEMRPLYEVKHKPDEKVFKIRLEAMLKGTDPADPEKKIKVKAGCPVTFYRGLTPIKDRRSKRRSQKTGPDGKVICEFKVPDELAGTTIENVRAQVDGSTVETPYKIVLPEVANRPMPSDNLDVISKNVSEAADCFDVRLEVMLASRSHLKRWPCDLTFFLPENRKVDKTTGKDGKAEMEFELPLEKAGKTIEIRIEVKGITLAKTEKIELPLLKTTPKKSYDLELLHGDPAEVGDYLEIPIVAVVTDKDTKKTVEGVSVIFRDKDSLHSIGREITSCEGAARITHILGLCMVKYKSIKVQAAIKGMGVWKEVEIDLPQTLKVTLEIGHQPKIHAGQKNVQLPVKACNDEDPKNFTGKIIAGVGSIKPGGVYNPPSHIIDPERVVIEFTSLKNEAVKARLEFELGYELCEGCQVETLPNGKCPNCGEFTT